MKDAKELLHPERNILKIDFSDLDEASTTLANAIQENYYRLYPFLCNAARNFAQDRADLPKNKDVFVAFTDVPVRHK